MKTNRRDRVWIIARLAAHSNSDRQWTWPYKQEFISECKGTADNSTYGQERFATHSGSTGSERECSCGPWKEEFNGRSIKDDYELPADQWADFPTQSPVCSRDDELPIGILNKAFYGGNRMDRTDIIVKCLSEGRITTNPSTGEIFSYCIRGKEGEKIKLRGSLCNGYVVHTLKYHGIKMQVKAHQVIWISVNGSYDKSIYQIDHINRNKADNRISNLRLVTAKENVANSNRWGGKFSEEEKNMISILSYDSDMSNSEIAEIFGCSKSRIQQIASEYKLKSRLVGITFPKWRAEAIKALGNAWCVAVAYEIFRAINEIENGNK